MILWPTFSGHHVENSNRQSLRERLSALLAQKPAEETYSAKSRTDEILRLAMQEMRRSLRRGAGKGGNTAAERLNRERFASNKTKERFRKVRSTPISQVPKPLLLASFRPSPILDVLLPERKNNWVRILDRRRRDSNYEIRLENFSFIDDPENTIRAIKTIAEIECSEVTANLHFQDDFCIDIAPYIILSEIWPSMAPIFEGGRMMPPLQKVIRAVGLHRHLGMTLKAATDEKDVWAFRLQRRRPANTSSSENLHLEPQHREKVADGLCDAIDSWLSQPKINQELTLEGRAWISSIVGELLDNAERHSRPETKDGDWSIAAFMARRSEGGEDVFRCYFGFLSVGSTIAESLSTAAPRVRNDINRYCAKHSDKGRSAETLSTLFALQDGITRDPDAEAAGRGGYGLQEVLEMVSTLGHSTKEGREPRITIISGNACIRLRLPYIKGERKAGPDSPRVLWCNPSNSSDIAPDRAYVFDLDDRFSGTIISVAFTLDPDYFESLANADETGHDRD